MLERVPDAGALLVLVNPKLRCVGQAGPLRWSGWRLSAGRPGNGLPALRGQLVRAGFRRCRSTGLLWRFRTVDLLVLTYAATGV